MSPTRTNIATGSAPVPPVIGGGQSRHLALGRLTALGVAACALGLAVTPPATAGASPAAAEVTAADRETARSAYHLGVERFHGKDFHGALEAFEAADRIMGVPTTGLELGRTRAMLGLLIEARDRLLEVTRHPQAPDEPLPFKQARVEAQRLADDIAQRIPSVRFEVTAPGGPLPADVSPEIRIDGGLLRVDLLKVPRRLNPGPHTVEVQAPGFAAQRQTLVLEERDQRVVQFVLTPERTSVAGRPGDGASGTGSLVGEEGGAPATSPAAGGGLSPLVYVGFGVGGAGLLVGTITGIVTLADASSLDDACPDKRCSPEEQSDLDRATALGHTSTVGFIVGGVGVATGVIGLLISDWRDDEPPPARGAAAVRRRLEPAIGPGSLGLSGTF